MQTLLTKLLLPVIALSLVIPEADAKRMGSGRSTGRQSQMARQRSAPAAPPLARPQPAPVAPAPEPVPRPQPDMARRTPPPVYPAPAQRQAGSPWGGMLGGALLGLGLGSLMSSHDRPAGATVPGNGEQQANPAPAEQQEQGSRLGSILLWAMIALVALLLVRRARARARARRGAW